MLMRDLCPHAGHSSPRSGDDVRNARIDEELELVLEPELASLQARNLELVADRLGTQDPDSVIELTVLGLKRFQRRSRLVVIHCADFTATFTWQEPPTRSDDLGAPAAQRWKASRQTQGFVF